MKQLELKLNKFSVVLRKVPRGLATALRCSAIIFVCCLLFPSLVEAATLYLEPATGQHQPGDTFMIDVKIDTEGECINTVEANLAYDKDVLKAVDFSRGESILSVWVKNPEINQEQGLVSFSGGIPGGYCGRIPGDPGTSNSLGKVIFKIPGLIVKEVQPPSEVEPLKIEFLDSSRVLLNDGLGTPAKLTTKGATFNIREVQPPAEVEPPKNQWQEELGKDNIPPEPFKIEIQKDPLIFEGKYFIIFSTTDKQTGLDYYETQEEREYSWRRVDSPYLLEDQTLKSIIKVKAIDKAGNERIAEYIPEIAKKPFPWWIIILILVGAGIIWLWKKYAKKHK